MGELWKDINTSPLHNHHSHPSATAAAAHRQDMMFQDFLGPPPPTAMPAHPLDSSLSYSSEVNNTHPPVTVLSLNSGLEFPFLESSSPFRSCSSSTGHHFQSGLTNVSSDPFNCCPSFETLANSSPVLPSFGTKRWSHDPDSSSGDRRHKRMIKNRESAARSRARKQAYTIELEREVAHLMDENAKLKKQQEQLSMAAAAQLPKKNALHRSSTAPF